MKNKYIILFLLLQMINNLIEDDKDDYLISITFLDNIYPCSQLLPFTDENGFLYMVTGQTSKIAKPLYSRNILKFSALSGDLFENITFSSKNSFLNTEILFSGNNSKCLLTTTSSNMDIFNGYTVNEFNLINVNNRRALLNIDSSSFFYSYLVQGNENLYLLKMKLHEENGNCVLSNELSTTINYQIKYQNMISCDKTKDNSLFSCIYYSETDNSIVVSIFSQLFKELAQKRFYTYDNSYEQLIFFKKIIYFKDFYKFILINSYDNDNINLRYFEFNIYNNKFTNKLKFPNINDDYLNITGTQYLGDDKLNDAISFDSDKILKIFADEYNIIITLIQFHDNDNILTIKKYNIENIQNINSFSNPRLAIFRNSIVVCLSAIIEGRDEVGFFFIGYPDSNDIYITENKNISVNDLVSIKNNIFSFGLNIKILTIPENFIFSSALVEANNELKPGDYLVQYDQLIFKQYKKKTKSSLLFEGLAIGEYDDYSSIEIYPSDAIVPKIPSAKISGKRGTITFEINFCNNGFHEVESLEGICTNIQPKGYYLDEKFNIYRQCHPMCAECFDGSNDDKKMNCLKCENDYYLNNNTHNCLSVEPNNRINEIQRETSSFYTIFIIMIIITILSSFFYIFLYNCFCKKQDNNEYIQVNNEDNKGKNEDNKAKKENIKEIREMENLNNNIDQNK